MLSHNHDQEDCIKNCLEVFKVTNQCIVHCLELSGEHAKKNHINLMISCSQIAEFHAKLMMRNCGYSSKVAEICALACNDLADECETFSPPDSSMQEVIDACRKCFVTCLKNARETAGTVT